MARVPKPGSGSMQSRTPKQSHLRPPIRDATHAAFRIDDPYLLNTQYPEMSQCERCGIVHHHNRWYQPGTLPGDLKHQTASAEPVVCPACRKIADRYALGVVELRGGFVRPHREDLEGVARGVERRRAERNPLERIMTFGDQEDGFDILTTDERLAQQIALTLQRSYEGEVKYAFDGANQKFLRVHWQREK